MSAFVGRDRELAELRAALPASLASRVWTLTGAGGVGKSRLAGQLAADLADAFGDGVVLVEMAGLADPLFVPQAVASALGIREQPGRPLLQTLTDHLSSRRLLLVLDNCEHLSGACASLVDLLVRRCPRVAILATSRRPLGTPGEVVWRVPSLALPEAAASADLEQVRQSDAIRLFVARATATQPVFKLSDENAPVVLEICHRLDGIPLALELAAARLNVLGLKEIAARLGNRLRLLTAGQSGAPPRQRTLRASLDWSYGFLGEQQRRLLARLAVFAGGCTLKCAESVCQGDDLPADQILDVLGSLIDASLVVLHVSPAGEARYGLLETVREYAAEKLKLAGEERLVRGRHLDWYLLLAEQAEPALTGPRQRVWLQQLSHEHDNLRAALRWAIDEIPGEPGLRLSSGLTRFWATHGHLGEGRQWLAEALTQCTDVPAALRARALTRAGSLAREQGDYLAASAALDEALEALGGDDELESARVATQLGHVQLRRGNFAAAQTTLAQSLETGSRLAADDLVAESLKHLGMVALETGDLHAASRYFQRSRLVYERLQDSTGVADTRNNLGIVYSRSGRSAEALAEWRAVLTQREQIGHQLGIGTCLNNMAEVHLTRGDPQKAIVAYQRAIETWGGVGYVAGVALALVGLGAARADSGALEQARVDLLDAERRFAALGSTRFLPDLFRNLATVELATGNLDAATECATRSMDFARQVNAPHQQAMTQRVLGQIALARGDVATARHLLQLSRQTLAQLDEIAELARTDIALRAVRRATSGRHEPGLASSGRGGRARSGRSRCASCRTRLSALHRFCPGCGAPVMDALPRIANRSLQVAQDPMLDLTENRRLVSVLFADLWGSTQLAERLDPEDLRGVLTSYFRVLANEVQRYGGTLDKYIGDAVMAVFGAPLGHEDDAERAIDAALSMQGCIGRLNDELEQTYGVRLALRIGINTGEVVAGLLAQAEHGAYTVVGDTVNTAQRFEAAAPPGGVLVSATTRSLAQHSFDFEDAGPVTLKGKSEPQAAFRVLGRAKRETERAATPFIGRKAELARLTRALALASDGKGGLIHVVGEAGIGKSRLVRQLQATAAADVAQIQVRCTFIDQSAPYGLIARLLREILNLQPGADAALALTRIEPAIAALDQQASDQANTALLLEILGYGEASSVGPQLKRGALLSLVGQLLTANAQHARLLLVIVEDLQWADPASTELLGELVHDIESRRWLLVTTGRLGCSTLWPAQPVRVGALSSGWARVLVAVAFGAPVDDTLTDTILDRTGGNPFLIEEVVHSLQDSGMLKQEAGRVSTLADAIPRVPATVQEMLTARIDRLPPNTRRVLYAAAVSGRTFRRVVLEQLVADISVAKSLATLEREYLVVRQGDAALGTYTFRHALIQEVAYQSQLQSQRRLTHGAIAQALESVYEDRLDEVLGELAFHYEHSDNRALALYWLMRAADRARDLFANKEALTQYAAALERAADGEGPLDAATVLERMADVQALIGRYDEAIASYRAARERCPSMTPETSARLHRKIGSALRVKGDYSAASVAFEAGLAALAGIDNAECARICIQVGQLHWRMGESATAQEWLTRAVDIAAGIGDERVVAEALQQQANIPLHAGDPHEALVLLRRTAQIYQRLNNLSGIADVHLNLGIAEARLGHWDESRTEFEAGLELFKQMGDLRSIGVVHNNLGEQLRQRGELAPAITSFEQALAIWRDVGYASGIALALTGLGMAQVEAGELGTGRANLLDASARFSALGRTVFLPDIYRFLAEAELAAGDLDAAGQSASRALELASDARARPQIATAQRVVAEVALAGGDVDRARRLLDASRAALAQLGEEPELRRTEAVLCRIEASSSSSSSSSSFVSAR